MRMLDEAKVCNLEQFRNAYVRAPKMSVMHIIGVEEFIPIENFPRKWRSPRKVATVIVHWDGKHERPGEMFVLYVDGNIRCGLNEQYVHFGTLSIDAMEQDI